MAIDTQMLRAQLADFRTRKEAITAAVETGDEAIDAAVDLLNDRKESVRWSALRILSEIGDTRAVAPLIAMMEKGKSTTEAANALAHITGQHFGEDLAAWRSWAKEAQPDTARERKALSNPELVQAGTEGLDASVETKKDDRYLVTVRLPDGRSQRVYVVFSAKDTEGEPIVWLYTPCGESTPDKYEWALKKNLRLPHGAIGIAKIEGVNCFVMSNTHLRATVDAEDIAKSILALATHGDAVEKMLTGEDVR